MPARAFLGIDCGTQSTKALLVDAEDGTSIAAAHARHELIERADGTREQRAEWWTRALEKAVRGALRDAPGVEVAGIGVSGQQHGLVCLDASDTPVRPTKLWNDTTAADDGDALTERLGGQEAVLALTGNLMLPGYTAPKLAWLRRVEPARYAATRRVCLPHDYLNLWLTGEFVTEPGDASGTAYFDACARRYSERVLAAIDAGRDWDASLPRLTESLSVVGALRDAAAEALALPRGVPVSAGGGDNMCAAIGVGAISEGPVVVSLGTSGTAFAYRKAPALDARGEAATFCDSTGGWLPLVCTLNCVVPVDWARALLGLDREAVERALVEGPPGADGLAFLPHLAGERTPNVPRAAGALAGVRARHGARELVRAVFEGVTFGIAYGLAALRRAGVEPSEITLVGGGAASDAWAQLCADVFGIPVRRPPQTEAAAMGAALQARWVVDGARPVSPTARDEWMPRVDARLREAEQRADQLRALATAGRL